MWWKGKIVADGGGAGWGWGGGRGESPEAFQEYLAWMKQWGMSVGKPLDDFEEVGHDLT